MKKVGILGHFAYGLEYLDGQTVKTKNLSRALKSHSDIQVFEIDTHGWKRKPLRLLKQIKQAFKACDAVIMLPAGNGVKIFAPLLSHFKKIYKKKVFYDVIGGWLPEFLREKPRLTKMLHSFDGIWVEANTMRTNLETQGFTNVTVIPNFKELTPLSPENLVYPSSKPYKLCTFSRVMKEKGIETAAQAVNAVNNKLGYIAFSLDIYGKVDPNQTEWFDKLQKGFLDYIHYCGCVDSHQSVEVLKDYFALLFPTYYKGEGFAGTLIDAYSAGIPVIASDWRYNTEIITQNTGFVYSVNDSEQLITLMEDIAANPDMILSKKALCLKEAKKYSTQEVVKLIVCELNNG